MNCQFKNKLNECYINKKKVCESEDQNLCKYYNRQYPKSTKTYDIRFKKVLNKAIKKRDLFDKYSKMGIEYKVDYTTSIYENVKSIVDKIDKYKGLLREKRKLSKKDLEGDVLVNLASNLYDYKPVEILQKDDKNNTILIEEGKSKYICKIKDPLSLFTHKLKKSKSKDVYLSSQITQKQKISE